MNTERRLQKFSTRGLMLVWLFLTIEFSFAVQEVIDWAGERSDALILVTADHETGGLSVIANNGAGNYPTVTWSTGSHTSVNVPLYAWGVNAQLISEVMGNTELFAIGIASVTFGDFNKDGDIDGGDLVLLISEYGCALDCRYDLTGDGLVNSNDLGALADIFGNQ